MSHRLVLSHITPLLHEKAIEYFENADPEGFVYSALNNQHYLALVSFAQSQE